MNYTEKEQKGINKVESMNKFFDKVLIPAIGVLIIITLLIFIAGKITERRSVSQMPQVFSLRETAMNDYEKYSKAFTAYGYKKVEGYEQELSLRKVVDEELIIYQFLDKSMGDFTILRYTPSESEDVKYKYIALTVSSPELLNVTVSGEGFAYTVAFSSIDFSTYSEDDNVQYNKMMKYISTDELDALYELFEADIYNLAESCGIS